MPGIGNNSEQFLQSFQTCSLNDNDNDNESNFIAMNYINHITRDIQARLIDGKKQTDILYASTYHHITRGTKT